MKLVSTAICMALSCESGMSFSIRMYKCAINFL